MKSKLMYTCKDIYKLVLSEEELSSFSLVKFKMHLLICKSCKVSFKQMSNLKVSISSALKKRSVISEETSENLIKEIKEKLNL